MERNEIHKINMHEVMLPKVTDVDCVGYLVSKHALPSTVAASGLSCGSQFRKVHLQTSS